MGKKKKPDIVKVMEEIKDYVSSIIYLIKANPPEEGEKVNASMSALEKAMDKEFEELGPQEQAHFMFFAIMIISKLARLNPGNGNVFSNSILMAQTFRAVMDAAVSKLGLDSVDIAFAIENSPTYEMKKEDKAKILDAFKGFDLEKLNPRGNA